MTVTVGWTFDLSDPALGISFADVDCDLEIDCSDGEFDVIGVLIDGKYLANGDTVGQWIDKYITAAAQDELNRGRGPLCRRVADQMALEREAA